MQKDFPAKVLETAADKNLDFFFRSIPFWRRGDGILTGYKWGLARL